VTNTSATGKYPQRSKRLLDRTGSLLLVVDLQTKLLPAIVGQQRIVWNTTRLLSAARTLAIPHLLTEQYPEKLGATVPLGDASLQASSKRMFSCRECHVAFADFRKHGARQIVLCGIETHVCVLQTALDLLAAGWHVFVAVDAVGSRSTIDHTTALERLASEGVVRTTTESILFEWCETSLAPEFRAISALVRETPP
jgi:nicotinamidase-related amidase